MGFLPAGAGSVITDVPRRTDATTSALRRGRVEPPRHGRLCRRGGADRRAARRGVARGHARDDADRHPRRHAHGHPRRGGGDADDADDGEADEEPEPEAEPDADEPDLAAREAELPELIRRALRSSRASTQAAIDVYADAGEIDGSRPPLLSVSLLADVDRIEMHRELDESEQRLDGAVSRASRDGIDDEPFERLVELLRAEIEFLVVAAEAHRELARGFAEVEQVVEYVNSSAFGLADDEYEELSDRLATATDRVETATERAAPIAAATDHERSVLESPHHPALADRFAAGEAALSGYHDALDGFPATIEDLDDAETALSTGDDSEAFALAQRAVGDLEAVAGTIGDVDPPVGVEPLDAELTTYVDDRLARAREVRDEAEAALD